MTVLHPWKDSAEGILPHVTTPGGRHARGPAEMPAPQNLLPQGMAFFFFFFSLLGFLNCLTDRDCSPFALAVGKPRARPAAAQGLGKTFWANLRLYPYVFFTVLNCNLNPF